VCKKLQQADSIRLNFQLLLNHPLRKHVIDIIYQVPIVKLNQLVALSVTHLPIMRIQNTLQLLLNEYNDIRFICQNKDNILILHRLNIFSRIHRHYPLIHYHHSVPFQLHHVRCYCLQVMYVHYHVQRLTYEVLDCLSDKDEPILCGNIFVFVCYQHQHQLALKCCLVVLSYQEIFFLVYAALDRFFAY
jgi:hypothetical protein